MEKKICTVCGKEFEVSAFNSYLDDKEPACDPCMIENNNRERKRKLKKRFNK